MADSLSPLSLMLSQLKDPTRMGAIDEILYQTAP